MKALIESCVYLYEGHGSGLGKRVGLSSPLRTCWQLLSGAGGAFITAAGDNQTLQTSPWHEA